MSYQVLARKYRPQVFEEVIGQEAVTRTLKNSIARGRIGNAYIFCGPRGVGKTSVARLIAKMLNCEKPSKDGPCNKCTSCLEITKGNSMDVLEIDGASNRGIDEVRTLRENVKFSPSHGNFKIYIIDEVHMLTTEAFNALLKTLEEPPEHVKFIFATTEPHKVLPTIMSRCQRFDFKRVPPKMIFDHMEKISKQEKISIDPKAELLIARSADGSVRDALVILDQMVSFSESKIQVDDVLELLGMVHKDKIFEVSEAVIAGDAGKVTSLIDDLINSGKDPVFIANNLIAHYRDLMVLKTAGAPTADMAFAEDELARMKDQSGKISLEEILYILQNISYCLTMMRNTMMTRAPLEITLVRMTQRGNILALPEVLDKLRGMDSGGGFSESAAPGRFAATAAKGVMRDPAQKAAEARTRADNEPQQLSDGQQSAGDEAGDLDENAQWQTILNTVKKKKMSVYTFLSSGELMEVKGDRFIIGFRKDRTFNKEVLESGDNKTVIEEAASSVFGGKAKVEFKVLEFLGESPEETAQTQEKKTKSHKTMNPIIEKAMDVFGGRIVRDTMTGE